MVNGLDTEASDAKCDRPAESSPVLVTDII